MTAQLATGRTTSWSSFDRSGRTGDRVTLGEDDFRRMVAIERKRTERSGCPFLLMLINEGNHHTKDKNRKVLDSMMAALLRSTRDTDIIGWCNDRVTAGAIFTGFKSEDKNLILGATLIRVNKALRENLTREQFDRVSISLRFFPDRNGVVPRQSIESALHSDLSAPRGVGQEAMVDERSEILLDSLEQ